MLSIINILAIPAENQYIEFKRIGRSRNIVEEIVKSIIAMANAEGGFIIFGVEDPEKTSVKGLKRVYGIEENLENYDEIGREIQKIRPPLANIWPPEIILVEEVKRRVAVLLVPKAINSFHEYQNHVYVRQEKSLKRLTPHEVVTFAYAKGFNKADKETVNVPFSLLDTDYFKLWKDMRNLEGREIKKILEKTGLARLDDRGNIKPTLAAVLLFAEYPNDILDTKCTVRVIHYYGTSEVYNEVPNYVGLPKTIHGPVIKQVRDTHDYVLSLLRTGVKIPSGFLSSYAIPERAVKEAITNAIIHRDYHMSRDIEIKIFEDRIEIQSPGLLPFNITPANIGKVRAEGYRNDLLVKHLREFPSPPNLDQNEGVRAMRSDMQQENLYPPVFLTYPYITDAVRVILLNEKAPSEWDKVYDYLCRNKYITNEEGRTITGIVQRDKMSKILKSWVKKGLLIQIKPSEDYDAGTKYRLPEVSELKSNA